MAYTPPQEDTIRLVKDLRTFSRELIGRKARNEIRLLHNTVTLAYISVAAVLTREDRKKYRQRIFSNVGKLLDWSSTATLLTPFPRALLMLGNRMTADAQFENIASHLSELFDELFRAFSTASDASKVEAPATSPSPAT